MKEPDQTPTLAERLRASCECNLDSSPCGAEEMCLLDREAANEIDRLTAALSDTESARQQLAEGYVKLLLDYQTAGATIDRLTAALSAAESEKETYRARWLSCVTPEEAERLRAALSAEQLMCKAANARADQIEVDLREKLSAAERERDEALAISAGRLAVLNEKAEEALREWRRAENAEAERDSLREQLARADAVIDAYATEMFAEDRPFPESPDSPTHIANALARHNERKRDAARKRIEEEAVDALAASKKAERS